MNREEKRKKIIHSFTYHSPKGDQQERYQALREKGLELALLIFDTTPESLEQDQAQMLLNLAVMSANASVARNE
jgi:hypothetical protein